MIRIRDDEDQLEREIVFRENLTYMLRSKRISYAKLANVLDVSRAAISAYRLGRMFPSKDKIEKIAEVLDCKVNDLFDVDLIPWESNNDD